MKLSSLLLLVVALIIWETFPVGTSPKKGLGFTNVIKQSEISSQTAFGGASWVDFDGDGNLDLLLLGIKNQKNKLFRGRGDGTFEDVTAKAGLDSTPPATAGVFGDYDNDGCPDLYLVIAGGYQSSSTSKQRDLLFHNNCDGTFTDVTDKSGLSDTSHGAGAAWSDFDHDGYLDLYVANYGTFKDGKDFMVEPNILYHNNGNGTFTNVTTKAGVTGKTTCTPPDSQRPADSYHISYKNSYQPIWFDFKNNGWPDLFVATDHGVSPLYQNNGDGTFTDVTEKAGLCVFGTGMGVTSGDYDNDGYLDLYITNVGGNFLWHNNGNGTFSEKAPTAGVANREHPSIGWGTEFLDFDNDGNLDLYVVNGAVRDALTRTRYSHTSDLLYRGNGDGTFSELSKKFKISGDDPKSSAAVGDFDNDGFVDLFVLSDDLLTTGKSVNRLYRNTPNGNHWSTVQLIGVKSNRDGIGARLTLRSGGKTQIREVQAGSSFASENSLWQTFGLGKETKIDSLEIGWPSGKIQILKDIRPNQKIKITEEP